MAIRSDDEFLITKEKRPDIPAEAFSF